ncbi:Protein of unknown function [Micromonospora pattaloongensis]|uniref:Intracellular septation protein A n=1 Tax=Micromonospora pattaloongensis TaxID=405436 RepID=A0A1H3K4T6_9ACTN|nr:DUF3159 domain-containing protein [Micromonospora pattaloongensis]SDY47176.1 Protein of unknown function [Micromonospora pattaloongensis]
MSTGEHPAAPTDARGEEDEPLPSMAEMVADQLGGVRGLVESSVPVVVFVLVNVIAELRPAVIAAVGTALAIGVLRLVQRRPIRHAVNGLFGVGVGALIAWRSGDAKDFYLPGILYGVAYGLALLGSVAIRQPMVGWIWSMIVAGGRSDWRTDPPLIRLFNRLTVLWGVVWLAKVAAQAALYLADMETALGVARLVLSTPLYALLLAFTVWTVRRVTRDREATPVITPAPAPAEG